ncbi:uncharacterized protein LOC144810887 [Lissotriton helveticus]
MAESSKKRLFRPCRSCGKARLFSEDPHKDCLYCLHPKHVAKDCKYCRTFSAKTLRDREARLLLWLQKKKAASDSDSEDESSKLAQEKRKASHSEERVESKKVKSKEKVASSLPLTPLKKQSGQKGAGSAPSTSSLVSSAKSVVISSAPSTTAPSTAAAPSTTGVKVSTTTTSTSISTPSTKNPSTTKTTTKTTTTPSTAVSSTKTLVTTAPSTMAMSSTTTVISKAFKSPQSKTMISIRSFQSSRGSATISKSAEFTAWTQISPLPPSSLLEQDSEGEESSGAAYSPSQLKIKSQDTDEEEVFSFKERAQSTRYESFQETCNYNEDDEQQEESREVSREESVSIPTSLVSDLRFMINDYYRRFPEANAPPSSTPVVTSQPPKTQSTPQEQVVRSPPVITIRDDLTESDEDEQPEEGELVQDSTGQEWIEYILPSAPSPIPPPTTSPPQDIGGFHDIMEKAPKRFDLDMEVKETECFLYDFKDDARKSARSIPIIPHVWEEGLKILKTPASIAVSVPRIKKKYRAPESAAACLIGHPRPESVVTQAAQRNSKKETQWLLHWYRQTRKG